MNPTHVSELLERAAASVTPTETDPASRLVSLGRRSVQRRRRAWGTAGSVAAVVAAVVALPLGTAAPDRSEATGSPGTTVSLGDLSVAVPEGWRTSNVTTFDPCMAEPHTVYLAARWDPGYRRPGSGPPGNTPLKCTSEGQAWIAVVQKGVAQYLTPNRLLVKDEQLLQVEQPAQDRVPSMWAYRAFNYEDLATTAFISGDEKDREQLLKRITWPAGPAAPASGGLMLPDRITSATSEMPGMVVATDAKTLTQIRTTLAELRDPVPTGEECTLQLPGAIGIGLGEVSAGQVPPMAVTVVLGDATCPQAISTGGGRVRVPAGLGKELLDLIVASDRAAAERATKD